MKTTIKNQKQTTTLDDKYIDKIQNLSFQPVFILGLHRSGTTILYKLLNETKEFNVFTLYHLLYYDSLLYNYINNVEEKKKNELNRLLKEKNIVTRKTDHISVTADYEHEYVYIFSERNLPSKITNKNKQLFEELCKKLVFISGNNKPILLKNPYDFPNFLFIKQNISNAKFIFIHRNPLEVISSTMRLWRTRLAIKDEFATLYSKQYTEVFKNPFLLFMMRLYYTSCLPLGVFSVIWRSASGVRYYLKNIKYLSENDYVSIKYEDLCREPNDVINKVLGFLNMRNNLDFSDSIKPRGLRLTPEVDFLKKFIYKTMKSYFDYFGYKI